MPCACVSGVIASCVPVRRSSRCLGAGSWHGSGQGFLGFQGFVQCWHVFGDRAYGVAMAASYACMGAGCGSLGGACVGASALGDLALHR